MGGKAGQIAKRVGGDVFTLGGAEIWNAASGNRIYGSSAKDALLHGKYGGGGGGGGGIGAPGGMSQSEMLATTGGAPILGQIAMGANIDDALAGYLGISKDNITAALDGKDVGMDPQTIQNIRAARDQLQQIQGNTQLRQKAVDQLIQDYPNIMAQESQRAGAEYDTNMKQYVDQALGQSAAKYSANGGLSSGAALEAAARVGAENGTNRLNYTTGMGQNLFNTRLGEVNALRDFQNTMMGNQIQQGFSANQANLQRQFQGGMASYDQANQQKLQDQQSQNGMLGSLGSLAGTALGAYFGGPMGAAAGSQLGGQVGGSLGGSSPRLNTPTPNYTPYNPMTNRSGY